MMSVPFRMPEKNVGILEIEDDTANRLWNQDERRLVEQVTDQVSLALENAYLFGETQRALNETETLYKASQAIITAKSNAEVLQGITDCITSPQIGQCVLALLDPASPAEDPMVEIKAVWKQDAGQSPVLGTSWSLSQIPFLAASNRLEPQVVNDITNTSELNKVSRQTILNVLKAKALASFPLRAGELFLGWMLLESITSAYEFSAQEMRFFWVLAGQAATALERMRLSDQAQQQLVDLTIIQETTSGLTAALSYDEIASALLPKVTNAVNADVASMFALQGDYLIRIGQYPIPETGAVNSIGQALSLTQYPLTQKAIETRQPVPIQTDDPRLQEHARRSFRESGITANVTIPISGPQGVLGTLTVSLRQPGRTFTPSEIGLMQTMADQAAIAMQNARLFEQTQSALNRTNALYQVNRAVLTIESLHDLLQEIVDSIAQTLPADRAFLLTFDFDARVVTNEVIGGPGVVDNPSMPFDHYMSGLTGWAIREAKPVISPKNVPDPRESPEVQKRRNESNTGAVVVVPLQYRGQILGTVTVINRMDQPDFTEQDVELLSAMASQIAVAVENRRLFEQTQASLAETELLYRASADLNVAKTNEDILTILRRSTVLGHPSASNITVNLFDRPWTGADKPDWMIPISCWSRTEQPDMPSTRYPLSYWTMTDQDTGTEQNTTVKQLFNAESPMMIEDAVNDPRLNPTTRSIYVNQMGAMSLLFVPLVVGGQWIGHMVAVYADRTTFSSKETRPLMILTGQAAVTIQNLRLLEETSRRANQLATAAEIARDTSSTLALDILLKRAVNAIQERYGYYHASIFLTDETGQYAIIRESTGKAGEEMKLQNHKLPINSQSIVGEVSASGKSVVVNDVSQSPLHRPNPLLPETRAESAIPLKSGERVIGALDVQATQIDAFTRDDITVLQTLADQLANAIENARLFAERREAEDTLASERNLLRTLIDNLPDVIYAKDADSRMVMANMAQARLLGAATPEDLVGRTDFDFFPQEIASKYYSDEQDLIRSGRALINEEEPTIDPLGNPRWLSSTKVPLRDSRGNITGFVGVGRDITDSKAAQAERERLLAEVERRATQLQAAAEVSRATSSILNPDELMQVAVKLVRERFNLYYVGLFLLDETGKGSQARKRFAVLKAGTGEAGQEMVSRGHKLEVGGGSMIGWCITNRQARVTQDVTVKDKPGDEAGIETPIIRFANPFLPATRSELALPLISRDQVRGAMTVQSEHENAFSTEDITVLQTLADQIAVAVDNAGLFELTQQAEAEARQRLQDLSVVYEIGQALAGAPMESEEIANLISRYFIEVLEVPECVLSLYNPEEDVLRVLADLTRSEDYGIEAGEGKGGQRRAKAGKDRPNARTPDGQGRGIIQKEEIGEIYHLSDYPATIELMHTMQPLVIQSNDPQADPAELSYMWSHGIFTMVSLPLAVKGTAFGVIRLQVGDRERHFTSSQINLAMTLANAAAVSLENARLYQEQRETTEKLREVDKMKSQFLANMSHELRTPLNSIIGFSRVILKGIDGPVSELQQEDLTAINSAGQHLLNLINDILDISKIEAGKMELAFHEEVNLHDIINGAMSFAVGLTKDKPIKLEKVLPAELPRVRADATRLRQVLINFLSNATKFTEEGTITLKAGVQTGPEGRPEVLISVTDSGIGISQEDQKKLFLPFSQVDASATRKTGGSGLGLSISRLLIELHGGRAGVISDTGKGSTFYFTLPLPYTEPTHGNDETRVILAIDDDRQVISLYERYLKRHNYKVLALTDPNQAVERAREVNPFAITLDVMMPNRSGWQVLEALKADVFTRNIPVIVCSIVADLEKGFSMGAADYLTKPILEEDLVHSLDKLNRDGKIREVLAIDDDPDDLRLVQKILEQSGKYQVRVANGGPEGLAAIRTRPPHAIILDLFMPGVDGFTLLETIRTDPALRDIPVIIFTAGDLAEDQRQRLSEFSHEMINKGLFKEEDLLTSIEHALEHFIPPAR
jgi:PAS domain S-box-containing protein